MEVFSYKHIEWECNAITLHHRGCFFPSCKQTWVHKIFCSQTHLYSKSCFPIYIKHNLPNSENRYFSPKNLHDSDLASAVTIREEIQEKTSENFQKNVENNRKLTTTVDINLPLQMLHTNITRNNCKERKFYFKCLGPYIVSNMTKNSHCTKNEIFH